MRPGYSAGNEQQQQQQSSGGGAGRTILIAAVSAVAGAVAVRLLDRTVFKRDDEEIGRLKAELAERAGPRALPAARPQVSAPSAPPPGYVRIDVPRETMSDEFWARLAGELD